MPVTYKETSTPKNM